MIYKYFVKSNKDFILYPDTEDLAYFSRNFTCTRMEGSWSAPVIRIGRNHRPIRDFVSWFPTVMVVSNAAHELLTPLISDECQIFFLGRFKSQNLYAINILACFNTLSDIPLASAPPLFKIKAMQEHIFVSQPFVEVVMNNNLLGAGFTTDLEGESYLVSPQLNNYSHWIHD